MVYFIIELSRIWDWHISGPFLCYKKHIDKFLSGFLDRKFAMRNVPVLAHRGGPVGETKDLNLSL